MFTRVFENVKFDRILNELQLNSSNGSIPRRSNLSTKVSTATKSGGVRTTSVQKESRAFVLGAWTMIAAPMRSMVKFVPASDGAVTQTHPPAGTT